MTLATWLQAAGYRTGHVGKYLNGYQDATYVPPGWDDWQAFVDPGTYCMYDYAISDNGVEVAYGDAPADYQTDVLRRRSLDFVAESEAEDDAPFFLTITPLAPHLESSCNPGGVRGASRHLGTVNLALPTPTSFNEADMSDSARPWHGARPRPQQRPRAHPRRLRGGHARPRRGRLGRHLQDLKSCGGGSCQVFEDQP